VAFPLGFGSAGMVGWRFPGLFVYHNFSKNTKLTLAAMRGSWNDSSVTFGNGAGESGTPQFEARLDFTAGPLNLYVVGHYDQKDCTLVGDTAPTSTCGYGYTKDTLDGTAVEVGAKATFGKFSLAGNVYQGTAIGQQFGQITQFADISGWGGWLQGTVKFTPQWSANLFYGMEKPDSDDVFASIAPPTGATAARARSENEMIAASVMYSSGPYVFGVEWLNDKVTLAGKTSAGLEASDISLTGNQLSFSAWYKF
jgi:hypothetical protein